jgi:hypothetical protein
MKNLFKSLFSFILVAVLWASAIAASAQNIVVTLKDNTSIEVKFDKSFYMTCSGDLVLFYSTESGLYKVPKSNIRSISLEELRGDVNRDGVVDIADMGSIIDIMAGMVVDPVIRPGHVAVDLALPSGTQWASANLGASQENDFGLYFTWGDTQGYSGDPDDGHVFDWANYKWMEEGKDSWEYITKYQYPSYEASGAWYDNGMFVGDGMNALLPEDDAATASLQGGWRMPTINDVYELINYTTQEWVELGGVWGCKFTGENGNFIFIPAAGYREADYITYVDGITEEPIGLYWTKELYIHHPWYAGALFITKTENTDSDATVVVEYPQRMRGLTIRAVLPQ